MTTATPTRAFYAKTTLVQYGNTFEAITDYHASTNAFTELEAVAHLARCIEEGCFEDVTGEGARIDLKGLNAHAYASALVFNEDACKQNGHEWELYTNFQESDPDNWENPLS